MPGINVPVTSSAWTEISATLIDDVVYTVQNLSGADIVLQSTTATPSAGDNNGIYLSGRSRESIKPTVTDNIYAKVIGIGEGSIYIVEAV